VILFYFLIFTFYIAQYLFYMRFKLLLCIWIFEGVKFKINLNVWRWNRLVFIFLIMNAQNWHLTFLAVVFILISNLFYCVMTARNFWSLWNFLFLVDLVETLFALRLSLYWQTLITFAAFLRTLVRCSTQIFTKIALNSIWKMTRR